MRLVVCGTNRDGADFITILFLNFFVEKSRNHEKKSYSSIMPFQKPNHDDFFFVMRKKINMASAALIRDIFTQPSPDDTDESRGRISATANSSVPFLMVWARGKRRFRLTN